MKTLTRRLLAALLLLTANSAPGSASVKVGANAKKSPRAVQSPRQRRAPPARSRPLRTLPKAPAPSAAAPVSAAPDASAQPPSPASARAADLAALGAALQPAPESVVVLDVLPGSYGRALGLVADDHLAFLNGSPVRCEADVAAAWRAWKPGPRLHAVVRRGLEVMSLQSPLAAAEPAFQRGPKDISTQEDGFLALRLKEAAQAAKDIVKSAPALHVSIPARQAFWIKFPDGLDETVGRGDIVSGMVTMAVASDASLDFLCLPPRSLVWGKVLEARSANGVRSLRLHFFKARLKGGHLYPISARLVDVAGEQNLVKVSAGGTLVLGEPVAMEKRRRPAVILNADMRLRLEFAEASVITEPPQFYQAGPGIWIRSKETEAGRRFEISHVITNRSAEHAGLHVGDVLTAIAGRSSEKLEFEDALAALYGVPGSRVKVTVQKPGAKPATLELTRGVFFKDGFETPLPLPFVKETP